MDTCFYTCPLLYSHHVACLPHPFSTAKHETGVARAHAVVSVRAREFVGKYGKARDWPGFYFPFWFPAVSACRFAAESRFSVSFRCLPG